MQLLIDTINYYSPLSDTEEDAVSKAFRIKSFSKGHILLHEGETCQNLYFVLKGICRTFHDHTKKEVTTWFYPEGHFISSWSSFLMGKPSSESIQVLEQDTELAIISKENLSQLYDQHHAMERFGRKLAEDQLAVIDDYSRGYALLSAKEKYESLLSYFPEVTQRVNLGHIASLLGISQETLSRVRRVD